MTMESIKYPRAPNASALQSQAPHQARHALILYGSETGNSEDAAEHIGRMVRRMHFNVRVCEMDRVDLIEVLGHTIIIFVVSTTGQGEFPRNARRFWKSLLRKRLPVNCLHDVCFTTFGLGDSSYPKFNIAAKKLHKRLEQLGAREVYPRGEADEQHSDGIDEIFVPWSVDLRTRLLDTYPLPHGVVEIPPNAFLPPSHYISPAHPDRASEIESLDSQDNRFTSSKVLAGSHTDPLHDKLAQPFTLMEKSTNGSPPSFTASSVIPYRQKSQISGQADLRGAEVPVLQIVSPKMERLGGPDGSKTQVAFVNGFSDNQLTIDDHTTSSTRVRMPKGLDITLLENNRITPQDHWQDVRLLTFEMAKGQHYRPGDSVTIYPKNFDEDVDHIIKRCGWEDCADISMKPMREQDRKVDNMAGEDQLCWKDGIYPYSPFPTLRGLLTHHLDINAIPRRSQFEFMQTFAQDSDERNRLIELASPVYSEEFFDYATRPRRSILELLDDFPSVQLPWSYVVSFFPLIRGRQYSICTGGILSMMPERPGFQRIQILIALIRYQTVIKKIRQGLCSRYVASLPAGIKIHVTLEPNPSMYPAHVRDITMPLLMVAPGTGIAPIRSIIWDRAARELELAEALLDEAVECSKEREKSRITGSPPITTDDPDYLPLEETTPGEKLLFFGNRNFSKDFFFRREFCNLAMLRTRVFTAFSRDQREKIYVQDVIREQAELVVEFIEKKEAVVYICGSAGKMPLAVKDAIVDCLVMHSDGPGLRGNKERCMEFTNALERMGRWIQDTW